MIEKKSVDHSSIKWRTICLFLVLCNSSARFVKGRETQIPIIIRPIGLEYAATNLVMRNKSVDIPTFITSDPPELLCGVNVFGVFGLIFASFFWWLFTLFCIGR